LTGGDWSLKVGDGKHNHDMTNVLKGRKTVGRLNPYKRVHLQEIVDSNIPPRQMLTNLQKRNRTTSTTIKHVYNACHNYRRSIRGTRNDMQHLLKSLVYNGYVYHCRKYRDSDDVSDVFWAHLNSIKLFNTFSTVLVLDSTYKTNKYRLPLFEFVGNTSTMKTFSIAFAFAYMISERQDNVYWALKRCREMLHSKDLYPKVVVTDRDNALINVVEKVFPKATTLLCSYHIVQNVRAKCKLDCKVKDLKGKNGEAIKPASVVKTVMAVWLDIVNSETEEAYIDNWTRFKVVCAKFPKFLDYVEKTILDLVKEKFVRFWVDKNLHMGNTTTNRADSAHARLKKYLSSSMGDLSTNWQSVHYMLELQHTARHASFQTNIIMLKHRFKGKVLWSRLIRNMLREALHHLVVV